MHRGFSVAAVILIAAGAGVVPAQKVTIDWAMNATIIGACSDSMFCRCCFNSKPAAHGGHGVGHEGGERFCRFNNAFRVHTGNYGATKLDGAKFWVGGDLGDDSTAAEMKWAVLSFDPAVTKEQRAGIQTIVGSIYPVKWTKFTVGPDGKIDWEYTKDRARATLNRGKTAEVALVRDSGNTSDSAVISNLKYWGVPRNDGVVLMTTEVQAWRQGADAFEFKGANGFMITFDIGSMDVR